MTLNCDLDSGHWNQTFEWDTLSYFSCAFCDFFIKFTSAFLSFVNSPILGEKAYDL